MTHPHDVALLNDLVDDRLTPAAAEDLRRRLADEPALAAAHAELLRMRAALAAMPVPVAVPADFLARVRARAGLPPVAADRAAGRPVAAAPRNGAAAAPPVADPSVPAAPPSIAAPTGPAARPESSDAPASSAPRAATAPRTEGGGRVFALSRFAVPLAAGVGLVVGAGLYAALRTDRALPPAESARQAPAEASDLDAAAPKRKLGARAGTDAKDASAGAHDVTAWAGADGDASAGAAPPGGAPAGPDVSPAEKPGTPRGSAPVTGGAGAGAGGNTAAPRFRAPGGAVPEGLRRPSDVPGAPLPPAPLPPAPVTPPAPAPTDDAPNTPNAPPPDAGEGVTASGGAYGARPPSRTADAADAPPGAPVPEARGPEERGPEASDATSRRAAWARAAEGVDAVVIVRASSVDEARAQLALLALPGVPGGARGGPEAVARDGEAADRVLGSFVAELTPEAYAALTAVRRDAAEFLDHERPAGDEPASPDADAARDPTRARESAKPGAAETPRPGAATS
ncbi:MAG: hypothetical protein JNM10_16445, partial [Planctomycetia bacterium]|nr:hypothetical protein [Planctomycetia bacterium]